MTDMTGEIQDKTRKEFGEVITQFINDRSGAHPYQVILLMLSVMADLASEATCYDREKSEFPVEVFTKRVKWCCEHYGATLQ